MGEERPRDAQTAPEGCRGGQKLIYRSVTYSSVQKRVLNNRQFKSTEAGAFHG